jgi:hypothetical protein
MRVHGDSNVRLAQAGDAALTSYVSSITGSDVAYNPNNLVGSVPDGQYGGITGMGPPLLASLWLFWMDSGSTESAGCWAHLCVCLWLDERSSACVYLK